MTCPACVSPSSHNRTGDGYPGGVGVDPVVLNLCETRGGRGMHVGQRFVNTTAPATTSDSQPWLSPKHVQKARPSSPRECEHRWVQGAGAHTAEAVRRRLPQPCQAVPAL